MMGRDRTATLKGSAAVTGQGDNQRMRFLLDLRRAGISDQAVLRALEEVPRDRFVPAHLRDRAYADHALPIACGQTISQPYVVAYMTEKLELRPHHRVLEVGTGSGYQAAIISRLVRQVVTVERYTTLADAARQRLKALGYRNVEVLIGDGMAGAADHAPFDRVIVTAAGTEIPQALIDQLAEGGMLLAPVGPEDGPQYLTRVTKSEIGERREKLIAVRFVPLLPGKARRL
jgi:protein-L-isoaspartate(D-aspartate) O-methyltransferase